MGKIFFYFIFISNRTVLLEKNHFVCIKHEHKSVQILQRNRSMC